MLASGSYRFAVRNRHLKALTRLKHGYGGYAIVRDNVIVGDTWHFVSENTNDPRVLHEDLRRVRGLHRHVLPLCVAKNLEVHDPPAGGRVTVFAVDMLTDKRWDELLLRHPGASVFHSRGWLETLERTYHYRPTLLTSAVPGEPLRNGLVFCEVQSWITGRRLVSLPFSDHCDVLSEDAGGELELMANLRELAKRRGCRYAEIRPNGESEEADRNWQPSEQFCWHRLALDAPLDKLFSRLHKDCIQRKVRRAEKEGLQYENGRSEALLHKFYGLLLRTRRRHCLPPQPYQWFQNLMAGMGDSLAIRVASKGPQPVAAILTLSFKSTLTYKYGCSDERFNAFGGTPFLFWKAIQEAKEEGMSEFDLGRSDLDNEGLSTFKDRLGAQRTRITYWRCSSQKTAKARRPAWLTQAGKQVFKRLPDALLVASGKFLYRHIG